MKNQESTLKESIERFLTSTHNGNADFSSFESIFFRLIQTMLDQPLEITWFYSAVTFHNAKSSLPNNSPSTRVLIAKDLFNLLISCSNLSSALKKIALLAPVVYELYNIVYDCRKSGVSVTMEVGKLIANMTSYVVMCAGVYDYASGVSEFDNSLVSFEDLVRVWIADRGGGSCNFGEILKVFFPVLTDGIWKGMSERCAIGELVGIVLCELFFLRMCMSFGSGICTVDLLKDMQNLAVQTMKGFRNCYFLDMLLKMLLEPRLPAAALLSSKDAVILYKVLYDAVLLVDFSLYYGRWVLSDGRSRNLVLVWALVANCAIEFARTTTDEARAISYLNAFCKSQLVAELIKWASTEAGRVEQTTRPDILSPKALIRWLLILEDQGINLFDRSLPGLYAKALAYTSRMENESPEQLEIENLNQNTFVTKNVDVNKDHEMFDHSDNEFPGTPFLLNNQIDAGRKRKESLQDIQESRAKHVKLDFLGSPVGGMSLPFSGDNKLHCGGKAINAVFDDDMELL